MEQLIFIATLLAVLGTALLAGNFFAFSAFLMRALSRLSAERGIVAMQAITAAIKSPLFLVVFFGTAALAAILSGVAILEWGLPGSCYLLAGSLLFLMGAFPVTMMRNVPLNNRLAMAIPDAKDGREFWKRFQSSWALWNHIRTVTALLASAAFVMALVEAGSPFSAR
ncbi:MAG: anthrone oxygenase family protein [Hyphomicrobiales bacterium]